ncbi:MAG: ThuA domain-containing protein, partial [Bacteroidota bacterium]
MKWTLLTIAALLGLAAMILPACGEAQAGSQAKNDITELPSLEGKKVLMVYGGWEGHKPKEFTEKVAAWLEAEGAEIVMSDSLEIYADSVLMSSIDVIVPSWTMGKIGKEASQGLLKAIKSGTGIAGVHGGFGDSFRNNTEYQFMVGGQWVSHPGGGNITYQVDMVDQEDPLTAGIPSFSVTTEQYYMHVDPNVKVLASTRFTGEHISWVEGAVMPVIWKKTYGKGRVYYCSLGHAPEVFDVPEAKEILLRGIRWASGSKYLGQENWMSPVY